MPIRRRALGVAEVVVSVMPACAKRDFVDYKTSMTTH